MSKEKKPGARIFIGDDIARSREALAHALNDARAKDPDAIVTRFDDLSTDLSRIHEALSAVSMFGGKNIVVIDGLLAHDDGEMIYRSIAERGHPVNTLLIREGAAKKNVRDLLGEIGTIETYTLNEQKDTKPDFRMADAIGARDRRSAWAEFIKLRRSGKAAEDVHGTAFWVLKTLLLCARETKAEILKMGVKPYTYQKNLSASKNFSARELEEKLGELKTMYHHAHQGDGDLAILLERFLLRL